jgi:hypothetical protein
MFPVGWRHNLLLGHRAATSTTIPSDSSRLADSLPMLEQAPVTSANWVRMEQSLFPNGNSAQADHANWNSDSVNLTQARFMTQAAKPAQRQPT